MICTIFFSASSFAASFLTSYYPFVITYGFASGAFAGIVYLIPYYFAYRYFFFFFFRKKKKKNTLKFK